MESSPSGCWPYFQSWVSICGQCPPCRTVQMKDTVIVWEVLLVLVPTEQKTTPLQWCRRLCEQVIHPRLSWQWILSHSNNQQGSILGQGVGEIKTKHSDSQGDCSTLKHLAGFPTEWLVPHPHPRNETELGFPLRNTQGTMSLDLKLNSSQTSCLLFSCVTK